MTIVEAATRLNQQVHAMTSEHHFIALFLGALDAETRVLQYCVAGIDPPLWLRQSHNRVERLTRGGPVLGAVKDAPFHEGFVRLEEGDVILAYTDGMVDQEDDSEEPYGLERLIFQLQRQGSGDARTIRNSLIEAVEQYGCEESTDDKTLLVLKFRQRAAFGMDTARASTL
jgi:sigma-B regulation protein RsbU (phosphoserine phosphatase)